jgi:hypothetical protein
MPAYEGEYSGAALSSFIKGLGQSESVIQRILQPHGLKAIDPEQWYDLELARAIYYDLEKHVGSRTLYNVGIQMIESAPFPPQINDVPSVLSSLNGAYSMNVRGPQIGGITTVLEDDDAAVVTFSTPFPCHLEQGVVAGCCKKFGATPLLEHGPEGCRDQGNPECVYHISW